LKEKRKYYGMELGKREKNKDWKKKKIKEIT